MQASGSRMAHTFPLGLRWRLFNVMFIVIEKNNFVFPPLRFWAIASNQPIVFGSVVCQLFHWVLTTRTKSYHADHRRLTAWPFDLAWPLFLVCGSADHTIVYAWDSMQRRLFSETFERDLTSDILVLLLPFRHFMRHPCSAF